MKILENKGVWFDKYYLPTFDLNSGELVVIFIKDNIKFPELEFKLIDILTGNTKHDAVTFKSPLTFVEHFKESLFKNILWPTTVGEYIKKNVKNDTILERINYDFPFIHSKTKVCSLAGNAKKILALHLALSNTKNIIFDVIPMDTQGAESAYAIVKENVKNGGSAILIDCQSHWESDCTKLISIELTENL